MQTGFLVPSTDPNLVAIALAEYGDETDFGAAIVGNPEFGNPTSLTSSSLYIAPATAISQASYSNPSVPAIGMSRSVHNTSSFLGATIPIVSGISGILGQINSGKGNTILSGGYGDFAGLMTLANDVFGLDSEGTQFGRSDSKDYNQRFFMTDTPFSIDDPEDIAYFQIVDVKKRKTVVFPTSDLNSESTPGISDTKFRQFIVHSINENSQEKIQIAENSEGFNLYLYGSKPEVISISGVLKDSQENPWNTNMLFVWQGLMRATRLAEMGCIFQMYCDGVIYRGYPINFQRSKIVTNQMTVQFSFNMVLLDGSDGKHSVRKTINSDLPDNVYKTYDRPNPYTISMFTMMTDSAFAGDFTEDPSIIPFV